MDVQAWRAKYGQWPRPYGVYDLTRNAGWVSVGIDHGTAPSAVRAIGRWWQRMGRARYPQARRLLITADAVAQQPSARAHLEVGTAAARRSHRRGDLRLSLPARDEQMEHDRTPA